MQINLSSREIEAVSLALNLYIEGLRRELGRADLAEQQDDILGSIKRFEAIAAKFSRPPAAAAAAK